jgi:predicted nucleotidyltransferase component of viral defense system
MAEPCERVDLSTRREKSDTQRVLVPSEYDDLRPFVLTVISPEHLLAEKVRALLVRSKACDLFDIWLLINQGIVVDRKLIEKKLTLYEIPLTTQNLDDALDKAKADWARDLRPLLPQLVSRNDAASQIEPVLRRLIA